MNPIQEYFRIGFRPNRSDKKPPIKMEAANTHMLNVLIGKTISDGNFK